MSTTRILHRACGGHLFDYEGDIVPGETIESSKVRLPDGKQPVPFEAVDLLCPKCEAHVHHPYEFEPEVTR